MGATGLVRLGALVSAAAMNTTVEMSATKTNVAVELPLSGSSRFYRSSA